MFPTHEQVHIEAQARAFRSRRLIVTPEDLQQAYHSLILKLNYELVRKFDLSKRSSSRPKTSSGRTCRYCLRSRPDVKFSHRSHAIPECLGNRHLLSFDECDKCNQAFSESFEVHLDRMTRPMRAFLGVKGKHKPPKFESKGKLTRIWHVPEERRFVITDRWDSGIVERDEANRRFMLRLPSEPFSWAEVYRALVKIGFALLPASTLPQYDLVRRWLIASQAVHGALTAHALGKFAASLSAAKHPVLRLWCRKRVGGPIPRFIVELVLPHLAFIFSMPPTPGDVVCYDQKVILPAPDLTEQPGWSFPDWCHRDLNVSEFEKEFVYTVVLTYETAEKIDRDEFLKDTGVALPA